jgi:hypothetical protein
MHSDGALSVREFMTQEPVPLASIHQAVLEFVSNRDDVVLYGAQAVNAYVDEPRMTQDVDLAATDAARLAQEIQVYLRSRFHIAVRVRDVAEGRGFCVYQLRRPKNRHLVDLRSVHSLPPAQRIGTLLVVEPAELIAGKLIAYQKRRGTPKSGTDWRDLAMLLLTFPELKSSAGPVRQRLEVAGAGAEVMAAWEDLIAQEIKPATEDEGF